MKYAYFKAKVRQNANKTSFAAILFYIAPFSRSATGNGLFFHRWWLGNWRFWFGLEKMGNILFENVHHFYSKLVHQNLFQIFLDYILNKNGKQILENFL